MPNRIGRIIAVACLSCCPIARAATINVSPTDGASAAQLKINNSQDGDTIQFATGKYAWRQLTILGHRNYVGQQPYGSAAFTASAGQCVFGIDQNDPTNIL